MPNWTKQTPNATAYTKSAQVATAYTKSAKVATSWIQPIDEYGFLMQSGAQSSYYLLQSDGYKLILTRRP